MTTGNRARRIEGQYPAEVQPVVTTHPDQFAYVGVWSAGIREGGGEWEKRNEAFLAKADQVNQSVKLFSISVGDKDFALNGSKALSEVLTKRGSETIALPFQPDKPA